MLKCVADCHLGAAGAFLAGERRQRVGDVGEHVEQIALLGVDDLLHLGHLLRAEALFGQALQQFCPRVRCAPEGAQFGFVLEKLGQLAEEHFHELLRGHGRAVGMPEGRHHHVLDGARLAVGEFDLDFLAGAEVVSGLGLRGSGRGTRGFGSLFWLRLQRFAIPFRIAEVVMRLHEIVDREVVLAIVEPRAAADDLLELDHRVDRAHQHDVADVARVHAGRKLLRCGQNRRDGLFVVLKIPQMLFAERAVVGRDPLAIVRVFARLHLVDEVAHGQRVVLRGAEDQRLFVLVDLLHEELHAVRFAFLDLDDLVEVGLRVALSGSRFRPRSACRRACRRTRRASWKSASP